MNNPHETPRTCGLLPHSPPQTTENDQLDLDLITLNSVFSPRQATPNSYRLFQQSSHFRPLISRRHAPLYNPDGSYRYFFTNTTASITNNTTNVPSATITPSVTLQNSRGSMGNQQDFGTLISPSNPNPNTATIQESSKAIKTNACGIVTCLNIGVNSNDRSRPTVGLPYEAFVYLNNPVLLQQQASLEAKEGQPSNLIILQHIATALQQSLTHYNKRLRFRQLLDPTPVDVKKLCLTLRKASGNDGRFLLYFNLQGVPRSTSAGELWFFNKNFTQYMPLRLSELVTWVLPGPALFVFECSNAGRICDNFNILIAQKEQQLIELRAKMKQLSSCNSSINIQGKQDETISLGKLKEAGKSLHSPPIQQIKSQDPSVSGNAHGNDKDAEMAAVQQETVLALQQLKSLQTSVIFAACQRDADCTQHPALPLDVYTSFLFKPVETHLLYRKKNEKYANIPPDAIKLIPGSYSDRTTPIGMLYWVLTSIIDTLAYTILPLGDFNYWLRGDTTLAALFRGHVMATRAAHDIMRDLARQPHRWNVPQHQGSTPSNKPVASLPTTYPFIDVVPLIEGPIQIKTPFNHYSNDTYRLWNMLDDLFYAVLDTILSNLSWFQHQVTDLANPLLATGGVPGQHAPQPLKKSVLNSVESGFSKDFFANNPPVFPQPTFFHEFLNDFSQWLSLPPQQTPYLQNPSNAPTNVQFNQTGTQPQGLDSQIPPSISSYDAINTTLSQLVRDTSTTLQQHFLHKPPVNDEQPNDFDSLLTSSLNVLSLGYQFGTMTTAYKQESISQRENSNTNQQNIANLAAIGSPQSIVGYNSAIMIERQEDSFINVHFPQYIQHGAHFLPIVLQLMLSSLYRKQAMTLLAQYSLRGKVACQHIMQIGMYPYLLKLFSSLKKTTTVSPSGVAQSSAANPTTLVASNVTSGHLSNPPPTPLPPNAEEMKHLILVIFFNLFKHFSDHPTMGNDLRQPFFADNCHLVVIDLLQDFITSLPQCGSPATCQIPAVSAPSQPYSPFEPKLDLLGNLPLQSTPSMTSFFTLPQSALLCPNIATVTEQFNILSTTSDILNMHDNTQQLIQRQCQHTKPEPSRSSNLNLVVKQAQFLDPLSISNVSINISSHFHRLVINTRAVSNILCPSSCPQLVGKNNSLHSSALITRKRGEGLSHGNADSAIRMQDLGTLGIEETSQRFIKNLLDSYYYENYILPIYAVSGLEQRPLFPSQTANSLINPTTQLLTLPGRLSASSATSTLHPPSNKHELLFDKLSLSIAQRQIDDIMQQIRDLEHLNNLCSDLNGESDHIHASKSRNASKSPSTTATVSVADVAPPQHIVCALVVLSLLAQPHTPTPSSISSPTPALPSQPRLSQHIPQSPLQSQPTPSTNSQSYASRLVQTSPILTVTSSLLTLLIINNTQPLIVMYLLLLASSLLGRDASVNTAFLSYGFLDISSRLSNHIHPDIRLAAVHVINRFFSCPINVNEAVFVSPISSGNIDELLYPFLRSITESAQLVHICPCLNTIQSEHLEHEPPMTNLTSQFNASLAQQDMPSTSQTLPQLQCETSADPFCIAQITKPQQQKPYDRRRRVSMHMINASAFDNNDGSHTNPELLLIPPLPLDDGVGHTQIGSKEWLIDLLQLYLPSTVSCLENVYIQRLYSLDQNPEYSMDMDIQVLGSDMLNNARNQQSGNKSPQPHWLNYRSPYRYWAELQYLDKIVNDLDTEINYNVRHEIILTVHSAIASQKSLWKNSIVNPNAISKYLVDIVDMISEAKYKWDTCMDQIITTLNNLIQSKLSQPVSPHNPTNFSKAPNLQNQPSSSISSSSQSGPIISIVGGTSSTEYVVPLDPTLSNPPSSTTLQHTLHGNNNGSYEQELVSHLRERQGLEQTLIDLCLLNFDLLLLSSRASIFRRFKTAITTDPNPHIQTLASLVMDNINLTINDRDPVHSTPISIMFFSSAAATQQSSAATNQTGVDPLAQSSVNSSGQYGSMSTHFSFIGRKSLPSTPVLSPALNSYVNSGASVRLGSLPDVSFFYSQSTSLRDTTNLANLPTSGGNKFSAVDSRSGFSPLALSRDLVSPTQSRGLEMKPQLTQVVAPQSLLSSTPSALVESAIGNPGQHTAPSPMQNKLFGGVRQKLAKKIFGYELVSAAQLPASIVSEYLIDYTSSAIFIEAIKPQTALQRHLAHRTFYDEIFNLNTHNNNDQPNSLYLSPVNDHQFIDYHRSNLLSFRFPAVSFGDINPVYNSCLMDEYIRAKTQDVISANLSDSNLYDTNNLLYSLNNFQTSNEYENNIFSQQNTALTSLFLHSPDLALPFGLSIPSVAQKNIARCTTLLNDEQVRLASSAVVTTCAPNLSPAAFSFLILNAPLSAYKSHQQQLPLFASLLELKQQKQQELIEKYNHLLLSRTFVIILAEKLRQQQVLLWQHHLQKRYEDKLALWRHKLITDSIKMQYTRTHAELDQLHQQQHIVSKHQTQADALQYNELAHLYFEKSHSKLHSQLQRGRVSHDNHEINLQSSDPHSSQNTSTSFDNIPELGAVQTRNRFDSDHSMIYSYSGGNNLGAQLQQQNQRQLQLFQQQQQQSFQPVAKTDLNYAEIKQLVSKLRARIMSYYRSSHYSMKSHNMFLKTYLYHNDVNYQQFVNKIKHIPFEQYWLVRLQAIVLFKKLYQPSRKAFLPLRAFHYDPNHIRIKELFQTLLAALPFSPSELHKQTTPHMTPQRSSHADALPHDSHSQEEFLTLIKSTMSRLSQLSYESYDDRHSNINSTVPSNSPSLTTSEDLSVQEMTSDEFDLISRSHTRSRHGDSSLFSRQSHHCHPGRVSVVSNITPTPSSHQDPVSDSPLITQQLSNSSSFAATTKTTLTNSFSTLKNTFASGIKRDKKKADGGLPSSASSTSLSTLGQGLTVPSHPSSQSPLPTNQQTQVHLPVQQNRPTTTTSVQYRTIANHILDTYWSNNTSESKLGDMGSDIVLAHGLKILQAIQSQFFKALTFDDNAQRKEYASTPYNSADSEVVLNTSLKLHEKIVPQLTMVFNQPSAATKPKLILDGNPTNKMLTNKSLAITGTSQITITPQVQDELAVDSGCLASVLTNSPFNQTRAMYDENVKQLDPITELFWIDNPKRAMGTQNHGDWKEIYHTALPQTTIPSLTNVDNILTHPFNPTIVVSDFSHNAISVVDYSGIQYAMHTQCHKVDNSYDTPGLPGANYGYYSYGQNGLDDETSGSGKRLKSLSNISIHHNSPVSPSSFVNISTLDWINYNEQDMLAVGSSDGVVRIFGNISANTVESTDCVVEPSLISSFKVKLPTMVSANTSNNFHSNFPQHSIGSSPDDMYISGSPMENSGGVLRFHGNVGPSSSTSSSEVLYRTAGNNYLVSDRNYASPFKIHYNQSHGLLYTNNSLDGVNIYDMYTEQLKYTTSIGYTTVGSGVNNEYYIINDKTPAITAMASFSTGDLLVLGCTDGSIRLMDTRIPTYSDHASMDINNIVAIAPIHQHPVIHLTLQRGGTHFGRICSVDSRGGVFVADPVALFHFSVSSLPSIHSTLLPNEKSPFNSSYHNVGYDADSAFNSQIDILAENNNAFSTFQSSSFKHNLLNSHKQPIYTKIQPNQHNPGCQCLACLSLSPEQHDVKMVAQPVTAYHLGELSPPIVAVHNLYPLFSIGCRHRPMVHISSFSSVMAPFIDVDVLSNHAAVSYGTHPTTSRVKHRRGVMSSLVSLNVSGQRINPVTSMAFHQYQPLLINAQQTINQTPDLSFVYDFNV